MLLQLLVFLQDGLNLDSLRLEGACRLIDYVSQLKALDVGRHALRKTLVAFKVSLIWRMILSACLVTDVWRLAVIFFRISVNTDADSWVSALYWPSNCTLWSSFISSNNPLTISTYLVYIVFQKFLVVLVFAGLFLHSLRTIRDPLFIRDSFKIIGPFRDNI